MTRSPFLESIGQLIRTPKYSTQTEKCPVFK